MSSRGRGEPKRGKSRLLAWICKNKYLARGSSETNRVDASGHSVNSHNNLAGGVLRVPFENSDTFHQLYMDDIRDGHVFYYSENFTPVYHMCFDLDFKSERVVGDEDQADSFDYRYQAYVEITKTIRRFYPVDTPAEKFTVIVLEGPPKSIEESPDHCAYTKVGVHLVFPFLNVNRVQALYMTEASIAALESEMGSRGTPSLWQNTWEDVCDKVVHLNGNLRLPYSDKPMKCKECDANPACKRGSRSLCNDPLCVYQRKPENRVYVPRMVLKLNGNPDAVMLKQITSNPYRAIRMTSVRTHVSTTTRGFEPFEGCTMPAEVVDGKATKKPQKRKTKEARAPPGDKHYLEEVDKRCRVMMELVQKSDPHYAKLLFQSCFYSDSTAGSRRYLLHVRGEGSHYCLNKADDHHSSTIYFVFSKAGIRQKCFCRKAVPRISGQPCPKWSSELMVAPLDKLSLLFPDIETEFTFKGIYKRTKKGRVKKPTDDTVTFGCRRPQARSTKSNVARTMMDLTKSIRLEAEKLDKHATSKGEKAKRAHHVASGAAFDEKEPPSSKEPKVAEGTKNLTRKELVGLDWFQTEMYLAQNAYK